NAISKTNSAVDEFQVTVSPNPSTSEFTLVTRSVDFAAFEVRVADMYGKIVYTAKGSAGQVLRFGANFIPGVYIVDIFENNRRKTLKVIKAN
ncbi:MAG TPA: T9SS type A sorting domain-containing protein, partial [Parafilimonas sp.]|nr:T9SS type A sorting domain-containing protein [Parafilimonas sp.]